MEWFDYMIIFLLLVCFAIIIILAICLIRAIVLYNKDIRTLKLDRKNSNLSNQYAQELYELVKIKTTSYETGEAYHIYREKVKEMFPLVHQYFTKEKLGGNAIFTYKTKSHNSSHLLFVTHIDTIKDFKEAYITEDEVYGSGTFDSKALFYSLFKAVEEHLHEHHSFDYDLTLVMTVDDITTKLGNEMIVDKFLRQGNFFKLVFEEGIGIIDPTFLGMKSNYALIGVGVTGEVTIRYKVKKERGKKPLEDFVNDLLNNNIFKSKIDKESVKILNTLAKDMPFVYRLVFTNIWLFKPLVKRILDNDQTDLSKLLKTHIIESPINEDEEYYYADLIFELATHDTPAEIVGILSEKVKEYGVEYNLLELRDPSKLTSTKTEGYSIVKEAINNTYYHLYTAPYIITKRSEHRYLSRVSDCVIRFSPLYYPFKALQDAKVGNEYVMKESIKIAINFYKEIFKNYR